MAQNNGKRNSDIPVSKKRSQQTSQRQQNPYRYEDLVRRQNGQAPVRKQNDVYVDRNRVAERRTYNDYLSDFEKPSKDVPVSKRKQPQPQEYSKGGSRKNSNVPRKKRGGFFKFIVSVLMIFAILFVGATGYLTTVFLSADYQKPERGYKSSTSDMTLTSDPWVKNILLIGVDDKKGGTVSRSDTMILVSIDRKHGQIKMTSFMRDTYVTIPGHGEDKMNAACVYGGPQLVVETIEYNFGIDIDNYVLVDFNAFKDVIDSLGGVTVQVEQREAEYINRTSKQNIEYGDKVTLNGEEALVYVRIRYLDSDFYRTQRQRKVISAILSQVKKSNPLDLIDTGKTVLSYVETDMNPVELSLLSEGAVLLYMRYDIIQSRVPFDKNYYSSTINGSAVLTINKEETSRMLEEFIYSKAEKGEDENGRS